MDYPGGFRGIVDNGPGTETEFYDDTGKLAERPKWADEIDPLCPCCGQLIPGPGEGPEGHRR